MIHTVKDFSIGNETEVDHFLDFPCFTYDPTDVGNLISGSFAFSKSSLYIWKLTVHILLKPGLENFEHYFTSVWDECNCAVVWAFFGIAFLWDCNENWPFSVLWEGNGKPLQYSCLENPMNSMKRQNDWILKEELPRSIGAQHATGDQRTNTSRKNEGMEPKQKQYPIVDVTGDRSKVWCCKKQYCIGTWKLGPWIKANYKWSNRRWQEWTLTF